MRYIKWAGWIVIILFVFTGTAIYQSTKETKAIKNTEMVSSTATVIDLDYGSEFPGLHLRTETKDTERYTMSISIPTVEHETINAPIQEWIEQQKKDFLSQVIDINESLTHKNVAHLHIQLATEKVDQDLYSLTFTAHKYVGGANGQTNIQPFMVHMKEKRLTDLTDLFHTNEAFSEQLFNIVSTQIKDDDALEQHVFADLLEGALYELDQLKWIINKKHLTLLFNENEVASSAAGALTFTIPLEKLQPFLKEQVLDHAGSSEKKEPEKVDTTEEKPNPDEVKKYVALTFDDGPEPAVTPGILDTLHQYDAKATFFMLGNQVEFYPEIAKQMVEDGHEVANHTNSHPDLTKISYAAIEEQFNVTNDKIEQATGVRPTLLRPPYGAYNDHVVQYAENYGSSIVLWSTDSRDWETRNANAVYHAIVNNVTSGSIIIMHDVYQSTADALPNVLSTLANEGYEFVTVSELLALEEKSGSGPHIGTRATK